MRKILTLLQNGDNLGMKKNNYFFNELGRIFADLVDILKYQLCKIITEVS